MGDTILKADTEGIVAGAGQLAAITAEFAAGVVNLEKEITSILAEECAGDVASEFSSLFTTQIKPLLANDEEDLEATHKTVKDDADKLDETSDSVRSQMSGGSW